MKLTHGLHRARRLSPAAVALVCGGRRLSWAALVDRIARLAGAFQRLGLRDGDRVAILAANGSEYIETLYAAIWAGGVAVPVNSRLALPEMIEQMQDAAPRLLVVDEAFAGHAAALRAATPDLAAVLACAAAPLPGTVSYEDAATAGPPAEDRMRGGDDLACIFYTGGTTGRAKGVMLSHANLWANAMVTAAAFGLDEHLVHLHAGPLFHLAAAARVFTTTIVNGRHVVVPRFTPEAALAEIEREQITTATFVPTMLAMILTDPALARFGLPSLRSITYGASPMPPGTLRQAIARFPGVRLSQSYGMTELSPVATILTAEDHHPDAPAHRMRSAGRPVATADIRIVDPNGADLPIGEVGEIVVRGPMVMLGYWRRPELSRAAVRDGWMHTGDGGRLDGDGYLYVVDRIKDMIITGGENVYSVEVENALYAHPAVAQCAVVGIPDERWGERVHAVVVPAPGHDPAEADLVAHCRALIAGYKCPRSIDIADAPLPLSAAGKIDKAALRTRLRALQPVPG